MFKICKQFKTIMETMKFIRNIKKLLYIQTFGIKSVFMKKLSFPKNMKNL